MPLDDQPFPFSAPKPSRHFQLDLEPADGASKRMLPSAFRQFQLVLVCLLIPSAALAAPTVRFFSPGALGDGSSKESPLDFTQEAVQTAINSAYYSNPINPEVDLVLASGTYTVKPITLTSISSNPSHLIPAGIHLRILGTPELPGRTPHTTILRLIDHLEGENPDYYGFWKVNVQILDRQTNPDFPTAAYGTGPRGDFVAASTGAPDAAGILIFDGPPWRVERLVHNSVLAGTSSHYAGYATGVTGRNLDPNVTPPIFHGHSESSPRCHSCVPPGSRRCPSTRWE